MHSRRVAWTSFCVVSLRRRQQQQQRQRQWCSSSSFRCSEPRIDTKTTPPCSRSSSFPLCFALRPASGRACNTSFGVFSPGMGDTLTPSTTASTPTWTTTTTSATTTTSQCPHHQAECRLAGVAALFSVSGIWRQKSHNISHNSSSSRSSSGQHCHHKHFNHSSKHSSSPSSSSSLPSSRGPPGAGFGRPQEQGGQIPRRHGDRKRRGSSEGDGDRQRGAQRDHEGWSRRGRGSNSAAREGRRGEHASAHPPHKNEKMNAGRINDGLANASDGASKKMDWRAYQERRAKEVLLEEPIEYDMTPPPAAATATAGVGAGAGVSPSMAAATTGPTSTPTNTRSGKSTLSVLHQMREQDRLHAAILAHIPFSGITVSALAHALPDDLMESAFPHGLLKYLQAFPNIFLLSSATAPGNSHNSTSGLHHSGKTGSSGIVVKRFLQLRNSVVKAEGAPSHRRANGAAASSSSAQATNADNSHGGECVSRPAGHAVSATASGEETGPSPSTLLSLADLWRVFRTAQQQTGVSDGDAAATCEEVEVFLEALLRRGKPLQLIGLVERFLQPPKAQGTVCDGSRAAASWRQPRVRSEVLDAFFLMEESEGLTSSTQLSTSPLAQAFHQWVVLLQRQTRPTRARATPAGDEESAPRGEGEEESAESDTTETDHAPVEEGCRVPAMPEDLALREPLFKPPSRHSSRPDDTPADSSGSGAAKDCRDRVEDYHDETYYDDYYYRHSFFLRPVGALTRPLIVVDAAIRAGVEYQHQHHTTTIATTTTTTIGEQRARALADEIDWEVVLDYEAYRLCPFLRVDVAMPLRAFSTRAAAADWGSSRDAVTVQHSSDHHHHHQIIDGLREVTDSLTRPVAWTLGLFALLQRHGDVPYTRHRPEASCPDPILTSIFSFECPTTATGSSSSGRGSDSNLCATTPAPLFSSTGDGVSIPSVSASPNTLVEGSVAEEVDLTNDARPMSECEIADRPATQSILLPAAEEDVEEENTKQTPFQPPITRQPSSPQQKEVKKDRVVGVVGEADDWITGVRFALDERTCLPVDCHRSWEAVHTELTAVQTELKEVRRLRRCGAFQRRLHLTNRRRHLLICASILGDTQRYPVYHADVLAYYLFDRLPAAVAPGDEWRAVFQYCNLAPLLPPPLDRRALISWAMLRRYPHLFVPFILQGQRVLVRRDVFDAVKRDWEEQHKQQQQKNAARRSPGKRSGGAARIGPGEAPVDGATVVEALLDASAPPGPAPGSRPEDQAPYFFDPGLRIRSAKELAEYIAHLLARRKSRRRRYPGSYPVSLESLREMMPKPFSTMLRRFTPPPPPPPGGSSSPLSSSSRAAGPGEGTRGVVNGRSAETTPIRVTTMTNRKRQASLEDAPAALAGGGDGEPQPPQPQSQEEEPQEESGHLTGESTGTDVKTATAASSSPPTVVSTTPPPALKNLAGPSKADDPNFLRFLKLYPNVFEVHEDTYISLSSQLLGEDDDESSASDEDSAQEDAKQQ